MLCLDLESVIMSAQLSFRRGLEAYRLRRATATLFVNPGQQNALREELLFWRRTV